MKIKEIIGMMSITSVPQTPEFVKGVINLRGKLIPVVDLRLRFEMQEIDYAERTCIIVVEIEGYSGITADLDDKMKKVAEKHQKTPLDLFEMMK